MILGSLIVLLCAGGATAVFILEQVHTLVQDLSVNKALKVDRQALAPTYYGGPETLLLVGDDTRKVFKYYNGGRNTVVPDLANEMLLVRIDPSKPFISMMSIPRELWVTYPVPGGGTYTNRLNSAYTYGLTTLLGAIKQVTGIVPNHVIVTTFTQFENAINTIGCVYDTIDQRYYHNNANGGEQYQNVDLQPGYQCLNGTEAEQFVSYRHTDSSQIRDARDQSFLLAAKKQYGPQLSGSISRFERIFGRTVSTDPGLRSPTEILNLASLLITAAGLHVRQVTFAAEPCAAPCLAGDLTATPGQIQASVHNFLFGSEAVPIQKTAATAQKVKHRGVLAHLPLTPTLASNVAAEKAATRNIPFTAEFPKVQDAAGAGLTLAPRCMQQMQPCLRDYLIHAPGGTAYPIYDEVFSNGQLGQFYDVQGTTWTGAPLFANPDQTVRVAPRVYDLYYDGAHLQTVAWRENGAVYWVHNTLTNGVGNGELLAIAEQTEPITISKAVVNQAKLSLKAAGVPLRPIVVKKTSLRKTVGSIAGIVTLLALPLLALLAILKLRDARRARRQLLAGQEIGARLPSWGMPIATPLPVPSSGIHPTLAGTHAARPGTYTPPQWGGAKRTYRRSVWRTPGGVAAMILVIAVIAAGAIYLLSHATSSSAPARHHVARAGSLLPTVPVAVLNATTTPGAAGQLATRLRTDGVTVSEVGNVTETLPPGLEILYAAGYRAQALRVARLLASRPARVGPIDPVSAAAAGSGARVVVEIT
jgi:polyisoprenyl-teichoic acid--peptidoglycan teichoic acid transferase